LRFIRIVGFAALLCLARLPSFAVPPLTELGPIEGKVVWVDFWASWCVPCRRSFPWMNEMHAKYGTQGLQIIAVNLDKDRAAADDFLAETPAKFGLRFDPEGELAKRFEVQAMPSSYVLDPAGNVIVRHFGFKLADADEYEQQIQAALAAANH
jgi:thiol-disulfide isomerase/thioredoxin